VTARTAAQEREPTRLLTQIRRGATWPEIIEWLEEDPETRQWLTRIKEDFLARDIRHELPVMKAVELPVTKAVYQGFDVKRILTNMFRSRREYEKENEIMRVETLLPVGSEERLFVYTNKEEMSTDIEFLIFLFAERVSINRKYTNKPLKQVIEWLIEKYRIDITVKQPLTALAPDIVTLPRIVACFPAKICEYYHINYGKNLATFHDIGIPQPRNLSRSILCPQFTALIPRDIMRRSTTMQFVSFLVHIIEDDILHNKVENYTALEDIFINYSAAYHTPCTPQEARLSFCGKMGLLTPGRDLFIPVIEGLREVATQSIRLRRPADPRLEYVLNELNRLV
jgi:hypothetical protein